MLAFRLAHLSDPHLGPLPAVRPTDLLSKRLFGYLNWKRNRGRSMDGATLTRLVDDVARQAPDHIAITGDIVNIALPTEFEQAREWLSALGPAADVSVVPGNHDAYVPGAAAVAALSWRAHATDDHTGTEGTFPYVRLRPPVAIVGVSSAVATPPLWATGELTDRQAWYLAERLELLARERLYRIVLIHHPPLPGLAPRRKRLVGARRFLEVVEEAGCELVLHGHMHEASIGWIDGKDRPVPVVGVPSASESGLHGTPARYNLFDIEPRRASFRCTLVERGLRAVGGPVVEIARHQLS